jgi:hypothetical protein
MRGRVKTIDTDFNREKALKGKTHKRGHLKNSGRTGSCKTHKRDEP